uniref:EGF-like domain-containing protein n=1 Tax=Panagrolaimus sp. ES5 TaxID=591445 RepID=A0AC34GK20_9BILA
GIYYNATAYFRKGQVRIPSDAYNTLLRYITDRNNFQIGHSGLYINPYQPYPPYSACYRNTCHPKGHCIELGPNAYRCECGAGYRDKNPSDPGHNCLPINNFNECENPEDNECSENARCIDLEHLYKCECLPGFTDAAKEGTVPGSVCVLDYCSDVNFCPTNSTCVNMEQQAECQCNRGFVDIRKSDRRLAVGFDENTICLKSTDVNECVLGLHNCSGVAECVDLK